MKNATTIKGQDAAILTRLIKPKEKVPQAAARVFLKIDFDERDRERMHELAVKNQNDELTQAEEAELQSYLRLGLFLDLIHAKARGSLTPP
jgi:hypothetical protein